MIKHKVKLKYVVRFWLFVFITYSTLFYGLFAFANWHLNPSYWIQENVKWEHTSREIFAAITVIIIFISSIATFMFWSKLKFEGGIYRKINHYFDQIFFGLIILLIPVIVLIIFTCSYFAYGVALWDFNAAHWSYEIREVILNIILLPFLIISPFYVFFSFIMLDFVDITFYLITVKKVNKKQKNIICDNKIIIMKIAICYAFLILTPLLVLYLVSAFINWSLNPAYWQANTRAFFSWLFSLIIGLEIFVSIIWLYFKELDFDLMNRIHKASKYHLNILIVLVSLSLILYIGYAISYWDINPANWSFNDRKDLFLYVIKTPFYFIGFNILIICMKIGLLENFK
ncbi:hypothetical protein [Neisseria sp. Ec49-e6-T10]|uniref:hypothetical protein n=1 Tax=Neisseria sp. Ec49-e6-T10 TaxID=3140744 RepID=UPI003EB8B392